MSTPEDWLPPTRKQMLLTTKVFRREHTEAAKHRDWFLPFAWAMEKKDAVQSKMFSKFYFFLREYIPKGLIDRFAHIRGGDVMHQMLCHHPETTVLRHKATKTTDAGFQALRAWLGKHKSWKEALDMARREAERCRPKERSWKAPGLQSPAALAAMVIAYPDRDTCNRYKNTVAQLQVEWMMLQGRDNLNVGEVRGLLKLVR
jgi:hypothetical protein